MRPYLFTFACLCSVFAFVAAVPLPASDKELDVLQIPLADGKEIDVLTLGAHDQEAMIAERNKRTIGLLRELFPDLTKQIDGIVNRIIAQVIRVAGPDVLRSVLGNRPSTPRTSLDADFDDDDDDDDDAVNSNSGNSIDNNDNKATSATTLNSSKSSDDGARVQIDLPTFPPESSEQSNVSVRPGNPLTTESTTLTETATPTSSTTASTTEITTSSSTSTTTTTPATTTTTTDPSPIYVVPLRTTREIPFTSTTTTTTTTTIATAIPSTNPTSSNPLLNPLPESTVPSSATTTTNSIVTTPITDTTLNISNPLLDAPMTAYVDSLAASLQNELNTNTLARSVDESQLLPIIETLNRLLNSTNYFVATRDNFSTPATLLPTTATTTTTTTTSSSPPPTATTTTTALGTTTSVATTPKITKLLPNGATDTQIDLSAINKQLEETIRVARQVQEAEAAAAVTGGQQPYQLPIPSSKSEETIQLSFNNELNSNDERPKSVSNELQLSESKSPAIDELTLDSNEDTADLDDRNKSNIFKRFLQFGGAGLAGGSSSGSSGSAGGAGGAGSGNFLFDIVRLFSGSVQTQAGDESANSVSGSSSGDGDSDSNRANDGYTEGIPGPVTRLVVLANRGLANLVQDLILRVAATSEKFVNFKAKLITALI